MARTPADRSSGLAVAWRITPAEIAAANFKAKRAIAELDEIVYGIIRERRKSGADTGDLLSMLLAATSDEDGDGGMDDVQLRDECITLLLAGHETTALTLTFCFHLLAKHPEIMAKLLAEIETVLGDLASQYNRLTVVGDFDPRDRKSVV
mgnify:CR=1 FL=1